MDEIKTAIRQAFLKSENGVLRGSQLGSLIKSDLCKIYDVIDNFVAIRQFKIEFGGLGRFIGLHCQDFIKVVDTSGLDYVYSIKKNDYVVDDSSADLRFTIDPSDIKHTKSWKTFTNPNTEGFLYVRLTDGSIIFSPSREESRGNAIIEVMSKEDHRNLIIDFIKKNIGSDSELLSENQIIKGENYWAFWQNFLADECKMKTSWMSYRRQKLLETFIDRLRSTGLSEQNLHQVFNNLKIEQRKEARTDESFKDTTLEFRKKIIAIVMRMELDDLEALNFPAKYL
jgi:predicted DNA binding CopG/RHH family protein